MTLQELFSGYESLRNDPHMRSMSMDMYMDAGRQFSKVFDIRPLDGLVFALLFARGGQIVPYSALAVGVWDATGDDLSLGQIQSAVSRIREVIDPLPIEIITHPSEGYRMILDAPWHPDRLAEVMERV